jgi:maleamate amidohydrolase
MADSDGLYVPDLPADGEPTFYNNEPRYGNRVGWGERPALLVVDMTLAFIEEGGDEGEECVAATERLLDGAREAEIPVFYTTPTPAGTFPEGYPVTTKASHASDRGPEPTGDPEREEWVGKLDEIAPSLEPTAGEVVIEKPRASAFFDTHLANLLRHEGIDTLIVAGMTTGGCVMASVVDSHSSNFRTIVAEECVADPSTLSHEVGLLDMDAKYADVTPLSAVLDRVGDYA